MEEGVRLRLRWLKKLDSGKGEDGTKWTLYRAKYIAKGYALTAKILAIGAPAVPEFVEVKFGERKPVRELQLFETRKEEGGKSEGAETE